LTEQPHLDEFQKLLHAMAHVTEQADPAGFIRRCDAIDLLEWHFAEFSNAHPADQTERASVLHDQAIALSRQLQQMNAVVVQALRQDIATGRRLRGDLVNELQRYVAEPLTTEADGNVEYDALDVVVAGVLGTDRLLDDEPADTLPEMVAYQPTPARVILEIVKQTNLSPPDIFVDIGSGLGVVPTLVSLLSGAAAIGIEVQPSYCRYAEECVRRLNLSNVRFICQDARHADFSVGTVFYMYTPFKGEMLQQVLERLHAEGLRRKIRLCTYGPILSEAVQQPGLPAFERSPPAQGPIAVFRSKPT
jgi:histone methylation protein DOT1